MRSHSVTSGNARAQIIREIQGAQSAIMLLCGNKCTHLLALLLQTITVVQAEDSGSNNPFTTLLDTPPSFKPRPPTSKSPSVFPVFTHLLNAFPPTGEDGSTVSLLMEEDVVGGVEYGRVDMKEAMMHSKEDFVIEFNNPNHGGRNAIYLIQIYIHLNGQVS